eukprot:14873138-Ditylum_brightwellii.AAC.1
MDVFVNLRLTELQLECLNAVQLYFGALTLAVDVDYWIDALNRDIVTIATNGFISNKKCYFATVLHTDQQQLRFQGP